MHALRHPDRRTVLRATGSLLAAGGLAGCTDAGAGTTTTGEDAEVVEVGPDEEYAFRPGTDEPLRIDPGTTVRFDWRSDTHNVAVESVPDGADWTGHESVEDAGFTYSHSFDVPGRYEYVCTPHEALGMTGTILVGDGATAATSDAGE